MLTKIYIVQEKEIRKIFKSHCGETQLGGHLNLAFFALKRQSPGNASLGN